MPLYELINPSDAYTYEAPNIEVAGVCAYLLSSGYGAKEIGGNEQSPVLFGWDAWFASRGIDGEWVESHKAELADAWDSFLIGNASDRKDVEEMLRLIPENKRAEWRAGRQDRHRSSMSQIGEAAYFYAKKYREALQEETV